jgi:DNA-binding MarR family transcriptional regulator
MSTMSPSSPADPVVEYAGQLFFRLWRASHTQTAAALESIGITTALFSVLNYLLASGAAIQQEIGAAIGIDPSTMVSLIDELERAGLAKRRPHPHDRRAREVVITPKGRRTVERGRALAREVEDDVLQGLASEERRHLTRLLRKALASAPPQPLWRSDEGD